MKSVLLKVILIHIVFWFSLSGNAQTVPEIFDDCSGDMFFVSADEHPQWIYQKATLIEYLNEAIDNEASLKGISGHITVGLIINKKGKSCCQTIINNTESVIDSQRLKMILDKMPFWKPAKQNGKPIPFLHFIKIEMADGKVIQSA